MIKALNRLQDKRAVNKVLQRGFKLSVTFFTVKILKIGDKPIRLTVVVGKKISKKAVTRNKIKRRVREAFMPYLDGKRGASIVVFPRQQALDANFETLRSEAKQCLEKSQSF